MATDAKHASPDRLWQATTVKWFVMVFGSSLIYAIIRYHLCGEVSWNHFPLFIMNKATSLAAVIFLACSYLMGKVIRWYDDDEALRLVVTKFCGLMGFFLAVAHVLFSLSLLSPAYYGKYFESGGRMNLQGELALFAGVVGLMFLLTPALATLLPMEPSTGKERWKRGQRMGYVALLMVLVHLIALGLKGWLAPGGWHGGMPPISMVAALIVLAPLLIKRSQSRKKQKIRHHS